MSITQFFLLLFIAQLLLVTNSFARWKKHVGLKFGIERYDCKGFGICLIFGSQEGELGEFSTLSLDDDQIVLEVPFSISKESPDAFNGDSFIMGESYIIPLELSSELGSKVGLTLAKGKHSLDRTNTGFRIKFNLNE